MPRKSISFTEAHDAWIKAKVASGEYASDSEVIRDLIRVRKAEDEQREMVRAQLVAAEESGRSKRSPKDIRASAKARLKQDAKV